MYADVSFEYIPREQLTNSTDCDTMYGDAGREEEENPEERREKQVAIVGVEQGAFGCCLSIEQAACGGPAGSGNQPTANN